MKKAISCRSEPNAWLEIEKWTRGVYRKKSKMIIGLSGSIMTWKRLLLSLHCTISVTSLRMNHVSVTNKVYNRNLLLFDRDSLTTFCFALGLKLCWCWVVRMGMGLNKLLLSLSWTGSIDDIKSSDSRNHRYDAILLSSESTIIKRWSIHICSFRFGLKLGRSHCDYIWWMMQITYFITLMLHLWNGNRSTSQLWGR